MPRWLEEFFRKLPLQEGGRALLQVSEGRQAPAAAYHGHHQYQSCDTAMLDGTHVSLYVLEWAHAC